MAGRDPHSQNEVYIMDLAAYLQTYHSNLTTVLQLFESLSASLRSSKARSEGSSSSSSSQSIASNLPQHPAPGDVYPEHLPESALMAGIRSGQFLQGVLRVSRFRCALEAIVVLTE